MPRDGKESMDERRPELGAMDSKNCLSTPFHPLKRKGNGFD
jgi:hypothetical protein